MHPQGQVEVIHHGGKAHTYKHTVWYRSGSPFYASWVSLGKEPNPSVPYFHHHKDNSNCLPELFWTLNELMYVDFLEQCLACIKRPIKSSNYWASLVAQWLRICLPMQGTQVRALVWEDPTCRGATGPVSHNYWSCVSGACAPQQERPRQWEARAPRWRVAPTCHN